MWSPVTSARHQDKSVGRGVSFRSTKERPTHSVRSAPRGNEITVAHATLSQHTEQDKTDRIRERRHILGKIETATEQSESRQLVTCLSTLVGLRARRHTMVTNQHELVFQHTLTHRYIRTTLGAVSIRYTYTPQGQFTLQGVRNKNRKYQIFAYIQQAMRNFQKSKSSLTILSI